MVAFALYRGDLHKVPDIPRRWPRPERKISLKDFRILLNRRAKALARLRSSPTNSKNPNPPSTAGEDSDGCPAEDAIQNDNVENRAGDPCSQPEFHSNGDVKDERTAGETEEAKDPESVAKVDAMEDDRYEEDTKKDAEAENFGNLVLETTEGAVYDVQKRKKEIQEKLEVLNKKKHSLVQVLKQILNAEEQLKRQNTPARPQPPLQVDTPKTASDGNTCHDPEAPPGYRTTAGNAVSPSQHSDAFQWPLLVSVSGASHVTSSPSPAASGATPLSRDPKLPGPWS